MLKPFLLPRFSSIAIVSIIVTGTLVTFVPPPGAVASDPQNCTDRFDPEVPLTNGDGIREISSAEQLAWLTSSQTPGDPQFDSHILLVDDIDLEGCLWSPIYQPGQEELPEMRGQPAQEAITPGFFGTFDGGGHTISGLRISSPAATRANEFGEVADGDEILLGFFGLINGPGAVRNVTFEQPTITLLNDSFANDGSFLDAIGVVAGAVGRDSDSSSLSRFENISVRGGSASLECTATNGCVLQAVGGLAGDLTNADVSNVTIDMSISFLDKSGNAEPVGELNKTLTLPPDGSTLSAVGLLAGRVSTVTALTISTTGTLRSEVALSNAGGIAGEWDRSSITRVQSDAAIEVGGGEDDIAPQVNAVTRIGGLFGSFVDSTSTIHQASASGSIDIQIAAYDEADPPKTTTVGSIGGFAGSGFEASVRDVLASTAMTVTVLNVGEDDTVTVSGLGGIIGVAGDSNLSTTPAPTVERGLAIGSLDLTGISTPTTPEHVGAFIGQVVSDNPPSVSDSYWARSEYPSLSDDYATAATDTELRSVATYVDWSIATSWNQGATIWGICQQPEPSLPFLQWMTTSNPCFDGGTPASSQSTSTTSNEQTNVLTAGPIQMTFGARVGSVAAGTASSAWGSSMLPGSAIRKEVRSTPVLISTSTVPENGEFTVTGALPKLSAGNHRLLISGLDSAGTPWLVSLPFGVDTDGRFSWIGQPTFSHGATLAATGPVTSPLAIGTLSGILVGAGIWSLAMGRIRNRRQNQNPAGTVNV